MIKGIALCEFDIELGPQIVFNEIKEKYKEETLERFNKFNEFILPRKELCNKIIKICINEKIKIIGKAIELRNDSYDRKRIEFNILFIINKNNDKYIFELMINKFNDFIIKLENNYKIISNENLKPKLFEILQKFKSNINQNYNSYLEYGQHYCFFNLNDTLNINIKNNEVDDLLLNFNNWVIIWNKDYKCKIGNIRNMNIILKLILNNIYNEINLKELLNLVIYSINYECHLTNNERDVKIYLIKYIKLLIFYKIIMVTKKIDEFSIIYIKPALIGLESKIKEDLIYYLKNFYYEPNDLKLSEFLYFNGINNFDKVIKFIPLDKNLIKCVLYYLTHKELATILK